MQYFNCGCKALMLAVDNLTLVLEFQKLTANTILFLATTTAMRLFATYCSKYHRCNRKGITNKENTCKLLKIVQNLQDS